MPSSLSNKKTQLLWHEPAKYRRIKFRQAEKANPLESIKLTLFSSIVLLGLRWLVGFRPAEGARLPEWPAVFGASIGLGIFVAYGMPRLEGLFANSIVILSEKGVNNNSVWGGATIRFWAWEKIAFCYHWREELNGEAYPVLSFCDSDSIVLSTLCMSRSVPIEEVAALLELYGVPLQFEQ